MCQFLVSIFSSAPARALVLLCPFCAQTKQKQAQIHTRKQTETHARALKNKALTHSVGLGDFLGSA